MKTYNYSFCNAENKIEITDEWAVILEQMDKQEYLNERRETRRHTSLTYFESKGIEFADNDIDIIDVIEKKNKRKEFEKLLSLLKPQQQKLIRQIYYEHKSKQEIAEIEGVGKSAISNRLTKIYAKIKKLSKKG